MGKNLYITEKPSVARAYANILNVTETKDGYMESDEHVITWCFGHLVQMSYPQAYDEKYNKWDIDTLPFLPKRYKYEPMRETYQQFKIIKNLYHRRDISTLYFAGDSAREGLYIQMLVRMLSGVGDWMDQRIIWIDSQTEDEIRRGIREAKPVESYRTKIDAGYMRAIEDYAMGINFTRALTCKFGAKFNAEINFAKYHPIPVGRVMTCVLGMIVDRENEITNFKPTDYYKAAATIKAGGYPLSLEWKPAEGKWKDHPDIYQNKGFHTKEKADQFIRTLGTRLTVTEIKTEEKKKKAPYLFNLAELQGECTNKFKISPDKTLEIAQTLYEKQLTTYPRTDARVLSTAVAKEISKNLKQIASRGDDNAEFAKHILSNGWEKMLVQSQYVNDSKVSDHYAIIPTDVNASAEGLSELEQKVYDLIIKRFLAVFYPPAVYEQISVKGEAGDEIFRCSAKALKKPGFLAVSGQSGTEEKEKNGKEDRVKSSVIRNVEKKTYDADFGISTSTTQPPKRYTSGSLVLAMENAGNLIEDEELRAQIKSCGIGTSATRAEIIKKLDANSLIAINSKTQVVTPLKAGYVIYDIVKKALPDFLSPKMTASWEKGLAQIENGEITKEKYQATLNNYITKKVELIRGMEGGGMPDPVYLDGAVCPCCKGRIIKRRFGYACENYKPKTENSCGVVFGTIGEYRLTETDIMNLLEKGRTEEKQNTFAFKGKTKKYTATLLLQDDPEKGKVVKLEFPDYSKPQKTLYKCPACGRGIVKKDWEYKCACGFSMHVGIAKHTFTDKEVNDLLTKGKTNEIRSLKKKDGNTFAACVVVNKKGELSFEFKRKRGGVTGKK